MNSDEEASDDAESSVGTVPVADLHFEAVPAAPERLPELRRALGEWAERIGMDAEQVELLTLASYEALANAAAHAYSDGEGVLEVHATYLPGRARAQVTVTDFGAWRPESSERGQLGGRGLMLIRQLAERADVSTDATGTAVRMSWTVPAEAPAPR